jgi:hypothetical protein
MSLLYQIAAALIVAVVAVICAIRWRAFVNSGRVRHVDMLAANLEAAVRRNDFLERLLITQEQRLVAIAARIEALEGDGR